MEKDNKILTYSHQSKAAYDEIHIDDPDLDENERDAAVSLPKAVYFIIPNELAERFCFYGIRPLLRNFFVTSLGYKMNEAKELYHAFNMMCYFFPLVGAAISDSFLNKFWTISILSSVYVIGAILLAVSAVPNWLGVPPNIPQWPSWIGLLLISLGTGGIKPCVSALGGDQFLSFNKYGLNQFYNYFYMAINVGAILAGVAPLIQEKNFYGNDGDGYPVVFGMCAGVLGLATLLFIFGKPFYRIIPPAGVFLPGKILKTGGSYLYFLIKFRGDSGFAKEAVEEVHGKELLNEYLEMMRVIGVLLPAPFFWMAFDQSGSSWQELTDQMDSTNFLDSVMINTITNPILIVIISPLFANYVYPAIDKRFPKKFGLLNRMVLGMLISGLSYIVCAILQSHAEQTCQISVTESNGVTLEVCISKGFSTAYFLIPYILITIGEVLFSVSGLNFTYTEVGPRMKSSCAAIWLLTVAIGNLLAVAFFEATEDWSRSSYFYLIAAICFTAGVFQAILNNFYIYKENREK